MAAEMQGLLARTCGALELAVYECALEHECSVYDSACTQERGAALLTPHKDSFSDLEKSFSWPIAGFADSLTRTMRREFQKEENKAKPLLKHAVKLMRRDADLCKVLGTPSHYGEMVSQQSETTTLNHETSMRIVDSFEVVGSKGRGRATLLADKYGPKHIQALRADVNGVHYDMDA